MPNIMEPQEQLEDPTLNEAVAEDEVVSEAALQVKSRKRLFILIGIIAGCAVIFLGVRYFIWAAGHEETDDAYLQGHVHPVSSRIAGTVQKVLVDDNQHVIQGQTLATLDPRDYQVRFQQAQAALDSALRQAQTAQASIRTTSETATALSTEARGAIGEATAGISAAKADVAVAQAGVPRAAAELAKADATEHRAELDLHRYEDLLSKGQVSRQTAEHARETYQVAVAAREAAQQEVTQAQAQLSKARQGVISAQSLLEHSQGYLLSARATGLEVRVRESQFASAEASAQQASAALEDAKLQLSYTVITAPNTGRVGRKSVEVGQRLQVGQPLLAVVEDNVWIVANFKETQLGKMRDKQPVEITIDSFPNHTFRGHIDSLAPGSGNEFALLPPDNATGNFTKIVQRVPVKIVFEPDSVRGYENHLSPGLSAVVTVTTAQVR
jgi:membrane fusion protein (multidrug efflux system)